MSVLDTIDTTVTFEWDETRTIGTLVQLGGHTAVVTSLRAPEIGTHVGLRIEGETANDAMAIDGVCLALSDGEWGEQQVTVALHRVGTTASAQILRTFLEQHQIERGGSVSVGRHRDNPDVKRYVYVLPDTDANRRNDAAGVMAPTAVAAPTAIAAAFGPAAPTAVKAPASTPASKSAEPVAARPQAAGAAGPGAPAVVSPAPAVISPAQAAVSPGPAGREAPAGPTLPAASPPPLRAPLGTSVGTAGPAAAFAQAPGGPGAPVASSNRPGNDTAAPVAQTAAIALGAGPSAEADHRPAIGPASVTIRAASPLALVGDAPKPAPSAAPAPAPRQTSPMPNFAPVGVKSVSTLAGDDAGLPIDDEELSSTQMLDALSLSAASVPMEASYAAGVVEPSFSAAAEESVIDDELAALLAQLDERTSDRQKRATGGLAQPESAALKPLPTIGTAKATVSQPVAPAVTAVPVPEPESFEPSLAFAAPAAAAAAPAPAQVTAPAPNTQAEEDPFAALFAAAAQGDSGLVPAEPVLPPAPDHRHNSSFFGPAESIDDHDADEQILVQTVSPDEAVAAPIMQSAEPGSAQDKRQKEVRSLVRRLFRRAESGAVAALDTTEAPPLTSAASAAAMTPSSGLPASSLFQPDSTLRVEIAVQFEWKKKKHSGTLQRIGDSKVRLRSAHMPPLYDRVVVLLPGNGPKDILQLQCEVTHVRHPEVEGASPAFDARITPGGNPPAVMAKLRDRLQRWATQTEPG